MGVEIFGEADVERMWELYRTPYPMSLDQVAAEMLCSANTVGRYLRLAGHRLRPVHRNLIPAKRRAYSTLEKDRIHHMYWVVGMTQKEVGAELGICASAVSATMVRYGIPTRTAVEAHAMRRKRGRKYAETPASLAARKIHGERMARLNFPKRQEEAA